MSSCGISSSAAAVSTNARRGLLVALGDTDNVASALSNTPNNIGQLAHLSTSNRAKPILKLASDGFDAAAPVGLNWKLAELVVSSRYSLGHLNWSHIAVQ
jgi:hypothetical protein